VKKSKQLAAAISELDDEQLQHHARRAKLNGASLCGGRNQPNITHPTITHGITFAIEAIRRRLGVLVYDEQIRAAVAMISGGIAEMPTGEGKTIAGCIPAIVHALHDQHVHVATANEYLARRDWQTLSPVFDLLGLTTGLSFHDQSVSEKQSAYQSDVVFATGYQFGFDYLRDQLTLAGRPRPRLGQSLREQLSDSNIAGPTICMRGQHVAIIDEIDAVLIDEAMTPLVLSGAETTTRTGDSALIDGSNTTPFDIARQCIAELQVDVDFFIDPVAKTVRLSDRAIRRLHESHPNATVSSQTNAPASAMEMPWPMYVQSALRAEHLLRRNVDYVVGDDDVQIVDPSTGRIAPDRQWRDGLHQSVETKENVPRSETRQTLARISRQRFFARYSTLCGMTGTASGLDREWKRTYSLRIDVIPTRLPSRRTELPTIYVADAEAKMQAMLRDVIEHHAHGQPILIGTRTIEQTRSISRALMSAGLNHRLLNGLQDEAEADLIAAAGRGGAITVATNMAGRGTDISPDDASLAAGGLHVIGFERNLSTRLDRQLLGRAARQGQPGSGRFFVAADDELIRHDHAGLGRQLTGLTAARSNRSWDQRVVQRQRIAESQRYETRQRIAQQEEWLNELRQHVA